MATNNTATEGDRMRDHNDEILSDKEETALRGLWFSGYGFTPVLSNEKDIRPTVAKSLVAKGLVVVESGKPCFDRVARLTDEGSDLCLGHDDEWSLDQDENRFVKVSVLT